MQRSVTIRFSIVFPTNSTTYDIEFPLNSTVDVSYPANSTLIISYPSEPISGDSIQLYSNRIRLPVSRTHQIQSITEIPQSKY